MPLEQSKEQSILKTCFWEYKNILNIILKLENKTKLELRRIGVLRIFNLKVKVVESKCGSNQAIEQSLSQELMAQQQRVALSIFLRFVTEHVSL